MSTQLAVIVRHYKTAFTEVQKQAFSGSDDGIGMLHSLISQGKLIDAKAMGRLELEDRRTSISYTLVQNSLKKLTRSPPIHQSRSSSTQCSSHTSGGKKIGSQSLWTQSSTVTATTSSTPDILPEDDKGKVCVDGKKYYLLRSDGSAVTYPTPSMEHWGGSSPKWSKMKGMDGLDDLKDGNWAGLKAEDLVARYVGAL